VSVLSLSHQSVEWVRSFLFSGFSILGVFTVWRGEGRNSTSWRLSASFFLFFVFSLHGWYLGDRQGRVLGCVPHFRGRV
jgi:uncharacterized membrane protein